MTTLADRLAQGSLWGRDDTIAKERKLKRLMAPKVVLPEIPEGPCCARCAHWRGGEGDDFGACLRLVVATERIQGVVERGTIGSITDAVAQGWPTEPLSTRGLFAGCSAFWSSSQNA